MATKRNHQDEISSIFDYGFCPKTREIFLHPTEDGIADIDNDYFLKQLSYLESLNDKPIVIHQYSVGGSIDLGFSIYDRITMSKCRFIFIVHGTACSFGSIIPQAVYGKGIRLTAPNSTWMLHHGEIATGGIYKQTVSTMAFSEKQHESLLNIWANVLKDSEITKATTLGQARRFLKNQFDKYEDWWLTAEEAVEYNLCDQILTDINLLDELKDNV